MSNEKGLFTLEPLKVTANSAHASFDFSGRKWLAEIGVDMDKRLIIKITCTPTANELCAAFSGHFQYIQVNI